MQTFSFNCIVENTSLPKLSSGLFSVVKPGCLQIVVSPAGISFSFFYWYLLVGIFWEDIFDTRYFRENILEQNNNLLREKRSKSEVERKSY